MSVAPTDTTTVSQRLPCDQSRWLVFLRPPGQYAMRLFCFPFAGGTAWTYRAWRDSLAPGVQLCAVQLPGRGNRINEPPFRRMEPLIDALYDGLSTHLEGAFAFFGHSLGALMAMELTRRLRREGRTLPRLLGVSGANAPHVPDERAVSGDLPEAEFIAELRRLNGTPPGALEDPALLGLVLPCLRADFTLCATYQYVEGPPLDVPIAAFGGLDDRDVAGAHLQAWRLHTTRTFTCEMLPGDHFFLQTAAARLVGLFNRHVWDVLAPAQDPRF